MTLLNTINVGGTDYGISGIAVLGACATPAGSEVKVCTFTDSFELKAGYMVMVKFTYANTYGDGSTTYPKLQVNGTNYVMRRADGNYLQSGEWGNNATLTFLFDGTDFILPAGSGSAKGSGVPLGTILAIHSNQVPDGYLPCNGVQFDTAQFAALYALLGDDHTPDLREVTLRGIGHNGTYVFDSTETDPSTGQAGTQNHDEYTLGQFKDDQVQQHGHWSSEIGGGTGALLQQGIGGQVAGTYVANARVGTVTRGKSVGVNYIIKATSGLPDDQQDYILNQLAPVNTVQSGNMHAVTSNAVSESLSYSTTEQKTGGKWIDGKPIYRKTLELILSTSGGIIANLSELNIDTVVNMRGVIFNTTSDFIVLNGSYSYHTDNIIFFIRKTDGCLYFYRDGATYTEGAPCNFTVEYTKTTD
jgi:hypothetical protein